jgi:adenylosuccinate lyase
LVIAAEAVMMDLAPCLGRQKAHDVVYEACKSAIENNRNLLDVLQETPALDGILTPEKLANLCGPLQYMGASQMMVDQIVKRASQGPHVRFQIFKFN